MTDHDRSAATRALRMMLEALRVLDGLNASAVDAALIYAAIDMRRCNTFSAEADDRMAIALMRAALMLLDMNQRTDIACYLQGALDRARASQQPHEADALDANLIDLMLPPPSAA